jgi:hypothetical protein
MAGRALPPGHEDVMDAEERVRDLEEVMQQRLVPLAREDWCAGAAGAQWWFDVNIRHRFYYLPALVNRTTR